MSTIVINKITHRAACTGALGEQGEADYDNAIEGFLSRLEEAAQAAGFGFEVDPYGQGLTSYYVKDDAEFANYEAAQLFMLSPRADFWTQI